MIFGGDFLFTQKFVRFQNGSFGNPARVTKIKQFIPNLKINTKNCISMTGERKFYFKIYILLYRDEIIKIMNKLIIFTLLIAGITVTGGAALLQDGYQLSHPPVTEVSIFHTNGITPTLVYIAQEKGFFTSYGLNVTFKSYPSTNNSLDALLDGTLDFGVFSEFTLSDTVNYHKPIRIISTIAESDSYYIVARKDKGIKNIEDLQGKKIGIMKVSLSDYFLDRFFVMNNLSTSNTTLVPLDSDNDIDALVNGDIDAIMTGRSIYKVKKKVGENAISWPANLGQHTMFSLVCHENTIKEHPEIVEKLLRALIDAETYERDNIDESRNITSKYTGLPIQYINNTWANHYFSVSLSQALISLMEDESRWRIEKKLSNETQIPDFSQIIAPEILTKLKPSAVTLI
jgi:NitT/TauT family transport system substrate-binding protein